MIEGVIGGLLSSLCCLIPLFLLLIGVRSINLLPIGGEYRGYFLIGGLVFISSISAYYLWKGLSQRCCLKGNIKKVATSLVSFLVTASLINFVLLPIASKTGVSDEVRLKIEGMTCEGCAVAVKTHLSRVGGVKDVKVNYSEGIALVTYDPNVTSLENIAKSLPPQYVAKVTYVSGND